MKPISTNPNAAGHAISGPQRTLWIYLCCTYLVLMLFDIKFFSAIELDGLGQWCFAIPVFIAYHAFYLVPVGLILLALSYGLPTTKRWGRLGFAGACVILLTIVQSVLFFDRAVLEQFGFHINGFVLNLLMTPGGIDSMGANNATMTTVILYQLGFAVLQLGLFFAATLLADKAPVQRIASRKRVLLTMTALLTIWFGQLLFFGVARFQRRPIVATARIVPFYVPMTLKRFLIGLGFERPKRIVQKIDARGRSGSIRYPAKKLSFKADAPSPNILWLVAESLRAEAFDPKIMPNTWKFAHENALVFENHYSGGNGTRWGMFSMFYGLYPILWHDFLSERRGPVIIDELLRRNYAMSINTSAKFTYPEFDSTLFVRIPDTKLNQVEAGKPSYSRSADQNDVANTTLINQFIEKSSQEKKPFFSFLFFESTHAPYSFDPANALRKTYLKEYNYLASDVKKVMPMIKARYDNSCHHVDKQIGRMLDQLKKSGVLKNTIVIITGDHGEEFGEFGRIGHNSQFSTAQLKTPMIVSLPGVAPQVIKSKTSHLDVAPTVLEALGVANPVEDYAHGRSLLSKAERREWVVCNWNRLAFVDDKCVTSFQFRGFGQQLQYFDRDMHTINAAQVPMSQTTSRIEKVLKDLRRFRR